MAKINYANCRPQLWLVKITVDDPEYKFSINSPITYDKLIKATNTNSAIRGAATYCTRKMKEYPGVWFSYSTKDVKGYSYPITRAYTEVQDQQIIRTKY